jgi:phage gp36-like protein
MAYTYCSYQDVLEKIQIADNGFDSVTYNSTTVAPQQENAESIINGQLYGYYQVPFTATVPDIINELCAMITAVGIMNIVYGLDAYEINKTVAYYQKTVEDIFKKIKSGEINLPVGYQIDKSKYIIGTNDNFFDLDKDWFDVG